MRLLKLFIGLALLPSAVALTLTAWEVMRTLAFAQTTWRGGLGVAFCAGYGVWLAVFLLLPSPMRTYVLGHELTHALWALLMGARVSGLRVSKSGGQVRTTKTNWVIALAPYFFPFYAMLFLALFLIGRAIWGWDRYWPVLMFFVGAGWSFHVTFTLMMLLHTEQSDVTSQGVVFSAVVIYMMNLAVMLAVTIGLSQSVTLWQAGDAMARHWLLTHGWVLDKVLWLWHRAN